MSSSPSEIGETERECFFDPPLGKQRNWRICQLLEATLLESVTGSSSALSTGTSASATEPTVPSAACGQPDDTPAPPSFTILELGCGEGAFIPYLQDVTCVGRVLAVDIDRDGVLLALRESEPLFVHYLQKRSRPLLLDFYTGSLLDADVRFAGADAAVCIEVIEHMHPKDLDRFVEVLFGRWRPRHAFISTPNSEYNEIFDMEAGKMRHWDHKFEFTREQFESWAAHICEIHRYQVRYDGVGESQKSRKRGVGFCTQIAVFHRLEVVSSAEESSLRSALSPPQEDRSSSTIHSGGKDPSFPYHLEGTVEMPCCEVSTPLLQRIFDEIHYIDAYLWRNYSDEIYDENCGITLCTLLARSRPLLKLLEELNPLTRDSASERLATLQTVLRQSPEMSAALRLSASADPCLLLSHPSLSDTDEEAEEWS